MKRSNKAALAPGFARLGGRIAALAAALVLLCIGALAETDMACVEGTEGWASVSGGLSNEKMAEGFIAGLMDPMRIPASRAAGSRLTGKEGAIYDALVPMIAEVAAGTRTSTVFTLPLETVYGKAGYTAAEFGLTRFTEPGSGGLTEAASQAIHEFITYDLSSVVKTLLVNCPYELYWFDKTDGYSWSYPSYSYSETVLELMGDIRIEMAVAGEYAGDGTNTVNPLYGQSARAAAVNARQIVADNRARSDVDKLYAYRDAICEQVEYNYDAANNNVAYGNPWQLVWVFDGDPETKVVCEGYSKAFQYLCDQSDFSGNITSVLVSGWLGSASSGGGGGHMWNVLWMDDGKNYLADITNCDSGWATFLAGYDGGSLEDGYVFDGLSNGLFYVYSEETRALYSAAELEISHTPYARRIPTGRPVAVEITRASETVYLVFTAKVSGVYRIWSQGEYDPICQLVDADMTQLAEGDDVGADRNFDISCALEAGGQYYLKLRVYDGQPAAFTITVETANDVPDWDLILPDDLTEIEASAFAGIAAFSVYVPDGCERIGDEAFRDCAGLKAVRLPADVVLGTDVFDGCPADMKIYAAPDSAAAQYAAERGLTVVPLTEE